VDGEMERESGRMKHDLVMVFGASASVSYTPS
jgi:hypothetical protein